MKELKVLKLTDVQGAGKDFYSEQFNLFLGEEGADNISETVFFITDENTIVDIQNDINEEDFKKAIKAGAELKTMFFVEDDNFGSHKDMETFVDFDYENVGYDEEYGVLLHTPKKAEEYERKLERVQEIEEALPKDEIMDIIDNLDKNELVEELYENHFYASQGSGLYINLQDGEVFRDTAEVSYTSNYICMLTEISLITDLAEEYVLGVSEGKTKVVRDEEERQEYLMDEDNEEKFERIITEAEERKEILEGMLEELTIDIDEVEEFYKI